MIGESISSHDVTPPPDELVYAVLADGICMSSGLSTREIHDTFLQCRGGAAQRAIAMCARCPVEWACGDDAYVRGVRYGVQGGESAPTRIANPSFDPSVGRGIHVLAQVLRDRLIAESRQKSGIDPGSNE